MVSNILAENNVNILNINQNIMEGFFNMVMIVESSDGNIKAAGAAEHIKRKRQ